MNEQNDKFQVLRIKGPSLLHRCTSQCVHLPSSVRRGGVLLVLRRVLEVDLRLRRMRMGEWLGSRFHRSRLSKE